MTVPGSELVDSDNLGLGIWGAVQVTLILGGLACMVHLGMRMLRDGPKAVPFNGSAWRTSVSDFVLFFVMAFLITTFITAAGAGLVEALIGEKEGLKPWTLTVASVCHASGLILIVLCYGLAVDRRLFEGLGIGFSDMPETLRKAGFWFLLLLPLMLLIGFAWKGFLEFVADLTIVRELNLELNMGQQEIVRLFEELNHPGQWALLITAVVVLAPVGEELFFRGAVYRYLRGKICVVGAMLITSTLFGLVHLNLVGFVPLAFLGAMLVVSYEVSGTIKVPILIHMLFNTVNAIQIVLMRQPPTGEGG